MVTRKTWDEFRAAGLLLIINQILHVFGWAIVVEYNEQNECVGCYPARVKFRGFDERSTVQAYKDISKYMDDNSEELLKEAES